ncbi:MAG TPA: ribosomal protein L7/L12 [Methanosarcina sp.]|nr:ribosomal protein L7/L12 [Methanosarcina sp.]
MIPEGHKDEIISNGIEFMRSITEAYGAEEGMKLWDAIADTLEDKDIKGQIFFELLTGGSTAIVTLRGTTPSVQAVPSIKAIRAATGLGLKEAKDIYDRVKIGAVEKITITDRDRRAVAISELRQAGMII